ncbi:MARTX multifunctional-autoprocessing repeats-in-toxin holotoxin RtxA [Photorhabdus khanii]|uniref:MARTX multifunctional-autoprocessing repeats-in-toxin holotoxin RtxA n=1 Tax=Photorhabdus khanii subsp. guanajuatensis TaxID=2100166 RepID=A0A4R4K016_9GAMM|nr:MARTX multifunctional-autoprocessing repeats-in-toxin holotoxin RtxA [Photorhabdus khanii]TDB59782.1 MARTX multifunctional-autoprocessing repeats-in-toxin holotoxin RtxA [Photorhabdus khanii subsp. guanajuatensis]
MGKSSNRSTEYFFTGKYYDDNEGNDITAIGVGGEVYAYGGDDNVTVGSFKVDVYHTEGELSVKGASGYAGICKTGNGDLSFAGAAGAAFIDHTGKSGDLYYSGAAGYNKLVRKGLSGDTRFKGAGGYNELWHETDQGNLYFVGAGAANDIDRTWFNRYQGTQGDVTFNGAGAANSIDSRMESGDITFHGAGADNHIVRKGREGNIILRGAGASNRIERILHSEDVYEQTRGDITFEGAGGYNKLYSDIAHSNIHFSGAGAYNEITRAGMENEIKFAQAKDIVMTSATMEGILIEQYQQVNAIKSTIEPDTYLFACTDSISTKVIAVRLQNNPETGKLYYYATCWYKEGNHLKDLAAERISVSNGFLPIKNEGAIGLSNISLVYRQKTTIHDVEKELLTNKWVTYAGDTKVKAENVTLGDAKMGGYAISSDGSKIDVSAVKSNNLPNTYVYAAFLEPYTKVVEVKLANDYETGKLKYIARAWYKQGDYTDRLANETFSYPRGYRSIGAGYTLSQLHYDLNVDHSITDHLAYLEGYSEQDITKSSITSGDSSGDIYFSGAGGGNVIISSITHGDVNFNGAGAANIILHRSKFGNTHFEGAGAANVIVKSGEEGDLTFRGAGLANVLIHQSQWGEMDVYAGGAANVLVRVGDGQYLAHLLAYGNISIHKGNGNSRVLMLGGYNTHTQIGDGSADWSGAGGFNVITQAGKGDISSVFLGGANVLTKLGTGDLVAGMLGGANIITHLSDETETSDTTAIALGGTNILTKKGSGNTLAIMSGGANILTHIGDGNTTGVMLGGASILTKVGNGNTTGTMLGVGNVFTHVGDDQTLGVMGAAGNIFTKVGDGTAIAAMLGAGNIFTHIGNGDAWALMGGAANIFTKVGDGNALALMIAAGNVFTHIGDGTSVALMLAKGNIATKVGNGVTLSAMIGKANIFTHVGDGNTFAAMIGGANVLTKVGNDLTAALMVGKANIYSHVGDGTSIGLFAGELNVMTKVGEGTTLAAMFGRANIMTHAGKGLTGVLALGEANIVTKVGDDFMGVVAAAKANVITHVGNSTTAAVLLGKGNILTKVGDGTTVGLLISDVGNVMTHIGDGTTVGFAKGKANIITKVGNGIGVNAVWGEANVLTQVGDGDRYNFAKGKANIIAKVGDEQEVTVVQGDANIITHIGNGDDYTGAWGKANIITKVGDGRNVVLAKADANIVTQVGHGDSFNALWSKGNSVTKVGDGIQVTAAKGEANVTTTVGNGLSVTTTHGDLNINTKVGDGVSVNVVWGEYNANTKVGNGLNVAVMKGTGNANIHVGDGLGINASYARNNVAVKIGNGDFYSFSVAGSNKLSSFFENIKQTALGVGGSQAINYLVQGDEANTSGTHKGRGAINLVEVSAIDGFQMDEIAPVDSDLSRRLSGSVTAVERPDIDLIESALNQKTRSAPSQNENLIVNGNFEQGDLGWQSTNGIEAYSPASVYGLDNAGYGERVSELDVDKNTIIWQELKNLSEGEVISLTFDFVSRSGMVDHDLSDNGIMVLWNGKPVFSASGERAIWHTQKLDLMAKAGTNRIEFKGTGQGDGLGYILDNIVAKSETSLIINGDFERGGLNWQSTNDIEAHSSASANGLDHAGYGERVSELDVDQNTTISQELQNLSEGEVISLSFDFANRPNAYLTNNGMEVFWNDKRVFSTSGDAAEWQNKTLELTAKAGSNQIEFKGTGLNDGIGYILDNIVAKSKHPRQTHAVTEHAKQDKAAQNALNDKEKAEKDGLLLEQEKDKQLAAIEKSQSQLELTDQKALNQSGLTQRNAIEAEAQMETNKLISMTQGLEVLDDYANYNGESSDLWRNQFATGFLEQVQYELDYTKFIAQKKLATAQQYITDNQKQVEKAVAESEAGVAKSEQHRASAKQDIADAKKKAELSKEEALSQQQRAKKAENDANIAYQDAKKRGERDTATAESKVAQVQADAKGAKQRDSRPDRTGAGGSGLSGKAYESAGAGETGSHIDPESMPEVKPKFYKSLTEEKLHALTGAKQAINRLQINVGVRAANTGVLDTSTFANTQSDHLVAPTLNSSGELVRRSLRISGVNLQSLGNDPQGEQHNSVIFDKLKFDLLKEVNKLFINPSDQTSDRRKPLSLTQIAVREIFNKKMMPHFNEEHVLQFEQALSHWQQRNPAVFALHSSQVDLVRFKIGRMIEHLQAQRAESVGILGITVAPQHAEQLNPQIILDGIGRVVGLRGGVTQDDIDRLIEWRITPLTRTNSIVEREAPRTESESLIAFMSRLEEAGIPETIPLIERARELWLTGQVTSQKTTRLFNDAAPQLQAYPELHALVRSLQIDARRKKATTQYIDNLFGRRFDSELAHELVKTVSPDAIATARRTGQFLVQEFEQWMKNTSVAPERDIAIRMQAFANTIKKDIRPWFSRVPELTTFLQQPTFDNFKTMMTKVDNGFEMIKIPFLAVKMSNVDGMGLSSSQWKAEGDIFYREEIYKTRSTSSQLAKWADVTHKVKITQQQTNDYGIALPYQPSADRYEDFLSGRKVAAGRILTPGHETALERNALAQGHSVVTGASGSTNIMVHLNKYIASQDPTFSVDQGYLNTLVFLVFDGGHSVNESLVVYKALQATGDKRRQVLQNYTASYRDLVDIAGDKGKLWIGRALNSAFEETQHLYREYTPEREQSHSPVKALQALSGENGASESVIIGNDGAPPRDNESLNPLTRFFNNELYGFKEDRRYISDDIEEELKKAIDNGKSSKITLKGGQGRLTGYYHLGDVKPGGSSTAAPKKVVLFIHGSGLSAEEQTSAIQSHYQRQGMDMLAINMRGYGGSDGGPSENGFYQDARTMFRYLVKDRGIDPGDIIIHGYSIGGSVAADLTRYAAQNDQAVSGLLLDRPMLSMDEAITVHETPNPGGMTGALAKVMNGQFSVEKNLKGLPINTPIMLLTDNQVLGHEGEQLRARLISSGYHVSGEQTFYGHEESRALMSQYADRIVSTFSGVQNKHRDVTKNLAQKSEALGTRFDGHIIIQMENDPIVAKAVINLAGKHPKSSVVVKLDSDGKYHVVYGDPTRLSGKLRWQIVGHGREESAQNNTRLSGYSADELAIKLKQFRQNFRQAGEPERISIVGCSLISDDKRDGFAYRFIAALDKQGIRSEVSARRSEVAVDATGRKFTRDKNNQWVNKLDDNKLVLRWDEQGELTTSTEKVRRGIAESDINLSRVGYKDADAVSRGTIADNVNVFTAPGKHKNRIEVSSNPQSDRPLSYSGNIQVNVGDGEFTAINWGTSNVGVKVGIGGFKSLAFGDNNVMVHIGDGNSKHSVNIGGYQAFEGAQMFIGNRNISFNQGRSNDLIVMMDKSIPTPPLVNPFDGAAHITGVLKAIAHSGEERNWLAAQNRQWTLSGAKKFVRDMAGLDQTSSVDYKTLVDLDFQHERSSRGLKSDAEATLNKKYNQWLSGNGNRIDTGKMSRADKFRQANEKLAFNFAVGGQGADIQVTTGSWNFMFGDHIQSILDTNLGSLFGLMTQQYSTTGMARTTFTYNPQDMPRQLKNKLLGRLARVNADTTLADIFGVDYTAEGRIVSRTGELVDGKAILQEMLSTIGKFSGDQLRAFTDPDKLSDGLKQNIKMNADGVESFFVSHGLKEKAPNEHQEKRSSVAINGGNTQVDDKSERAFGFNSLNLPNLFATIFSKHKQEEMKSLVTNLKANLTADLLNMEQKTFDFLHNSGHLQGDSDIHVSLGNYNFNWGGDGKDLGAYLGDNNNFWGGRGDDVYYSIGTSNIFTGGEGNDLGVLMGRENWMFGGDGDDTAVVAGRINHVFMGEGNDQTFVFGEGGYIDTGTGRDYVVTSGNYNQIDTGEDQDYAVTIGNNNRVELAEGNDFARVFGNDNRIDGNTGNDVIKLMGYHAVINGGEGDDHLIASAISKFSQFDGGEGQDLLVLGGYHNSFQGGAGIDSFVVSGKVIESQVNDISAEDMIVFNDVDWQNLWFQRSGYDLVLSVNRHTQDGTEQGIFESVGSVTFHGYFNGNRARLVAQMGRKDVSGAREFTALSDNAVDSLIQAMSSFSPIAGDNGFIESLDSKAKSAITTAWTDTTMGKRKFA